MQNTIYKILDKAYNCIYIQWELEVKKWTKYKIQNAKYKIQNTKYKIQNTKYKIQNTKYKIKRIRSDTQLGFEHREYKMNSGSFTWPQQIYKCEWDGTNEVVVWLGIKASEMLVAPRISKCFGLPWSALVCYSLLTSSFAPFGRSGRYVCQHHPASPFFFFLLVVYIFCWLFVFFVVIIC